MESKATCVSALERVCGNWFLKEKVEKEVHTLLVVEDYGCNQGGMQRNPQVCPTSGHISQITIQTHNFYCNYFLPSTTLHFTIGFSN